MFALTPRLIARDANGASQSPPLSHTIVILLAVLLILLILALFLVAGLLFMRQRRRNSKSHILPLYDEKRFSTSSTASSHRRVMVRPSESIYVYNEKQDLINNSAAPPQGPLPEIRITFPEEIDASGKRLSGRVVVVRVGDSGVGLEPVDSLPEYQQTETERFHSIDLDRVGGLVEKGRNVPLFRQ